MAETFFNLMNNSVFGKTMESVKKHIGIRHLTTNKRRSCLVSKPNYHTKKWNSSEMNKKNEQTNLFRCVNIRNEQNRNV